MSVLRHCANLLGSVRQRSAKVRPVASSSDRVLLVSESRISSFLPGSLRKAWRRQGIVGHRASSAEASPEQLFLRAQALARIGNLPMATRLYRDAVALDPDFVDALEGVGETLDLSGDIEEAQRHYDLARDARARLPAAPADRHFVLRQPPRATGNILAYDAVLGSLKKYTLPYLARGNAYLASGMPAKALTDYERALKLKPGLLDVVLVMAEALMLLGRPKDALKAFDQVIEGRASDAEAFGGRAIAHMSEGMVDDANRDWARQFALLPNHPLARACIALRMADYASARPLLEVAVAREPSNPYWKVYLAAANRRLGAAYEVAASPLVPGWPGRLLAFYRGEIDGAGLLGFADSPLRRAEAVFHLGVSAMPAEPKVAMGHWHEVIKIAPSSLIEYAAARNELLKLKA